MRQAQTAGGGRRYFNDGRTGTVSGLGNLAWACTRCVVRVALLVYYLLLGSAPLMPKEDAMCADRHRENNKIF